MALERKLAELEAKYSGTPLTTDTLAMKKKEEDDKSPLREKDGDVNSVDDNKEPDKAS